MIIYVENLKGLTRTPETSLNIIARFQDTGLNIQKLIAFLYANNKQVEFEIKNTALTYSFSYLVPVCCSMSSLNCCFLIAYRFLKRQVR